MSDLEVELQRLASVNESQAAAIISLRNELIAVERRLRELEEKTAPAPAPPVLSHERVGADWKRRPRKAIAKAKPKRGATR